MQCRSRNRQCDICGTTDHVVRRARESARHAPQHAIEQPLRIRVVTGIHAPLVLAEKGTYLIDRPITPVITSDGTLYVPHPDWCYDDEYVRVFAADGSPQPSLGAWSPRAVIYAAAFDEATGTLLFPHNSRKSPLECELVAVDAVTQMVRWSQFLGSGLCQDIAVLPAQDRHLSLHRGPNLDAIAVTSDYDNSRLCAHRLFDGSSIARVNAKKPTFWQPTLHPPLYMPAPMPAHTHK